MATLSYIQAKTSAVSAAAQAAASAGGDKVAPNERGMLVFRNGDGTSKTVTVAVPGNTKYGVANPDVPYVVPAGATAYIGPLSADLGDPADNGLIAITYSAVTSCTVSAVTI
jgi:hypothetical protein